MANEAQEEMKRAIEKAEECLRRLRERLDAGGQVSKDQITKVRDLAAAFDNGGSTMEASW